MGSIQKEYKLKNSGRITSLLFGIVIMFLGVGASQLSKGNHRFLRKILGKDNKLLDYLIQYWYLILCIGVLICLLSLLVVFYTKITVEDGFFLLEGNRGKKKIPFLEVRKIEDYASSQSRGIKIYLKNGRGILLSKNKIKDYGSLFHSLKEQHKIAVLGKDFPDNIRKVSFLVTKEIKVEEGKIFRNGQEIPYDRIGSFSLVLQDQSYNFGIAIYPSMKKDKDIMIKAREMENDDAFYGVLRAYCTEA